MEVEEIKEEINNLSKEDIEEIYDFSKSLLEALDLDEERNQ